jgi:hypothetical protein
MNPYVSLVLKSVSVFGMAISLTSNTLTYLNQPHGWLLLLAPGAFALFSYWGGVADSAPWTKKPTSIQEISKP